MSCTDIGAHSLIPRMIRRFSVPILLGWLMLIVAVNIVVPQLEEVGRTHSVSLSPNDAPSLVALKRIGTDFQESTSNSLAIIVFEGDRSLGDDAHHRYDQLIGKLEADHKHVEHIQDFWGDPLTAAGAQSADGKSAYVQVYLAGNQGESLANESVDAVRAAVASDPPPPGLRVYVTGPAAIIADEQQAGDDSIPLIMMVTGGVIVLMLLLVYRSVITMLLVLQMVALELVAARGIVAVLGYYNLIGLSTFAVNLVTALAIAAGTDYAIFVVGRYHEARQSGADREASFYIMYHSTAHVILGSGLAIAGATYCLSLTRLPVFQSLGVPLAIGMLVGVVAALTMAPALLSIGIRFEFFEPKRALRTRNWRRVGTAVVRWPGPILILTCALALIGLLALPSYKTSYNEREFVPPDLPANVGYAAADRHFPDARLSPELLLVETDHDVRNSADMLVIDGIAKSVFHLPGIARVQTITRPLGTPIDHSSLPFQISLQGIAQKMNQGFLNDRIADMLMMADQLQSATDTMRAMLGITRDLSASTHDMAGRIKGMAVDINELRDRIAGFNDRLQPVRDYFSSEPNCSNIPACSSVRSAFDAFGSIETLSEDVRNLTPDVNKLDEAMPKILTMLPQMIATMQTMKTMILTMHSTMADLQDQMAAAQSNASAMGEAFDASKKDDFFYLPPDVFGNPAFKRGLKMFVSPDGKAIRFVISHEGDPVSAQSISRINAIKDAAFESIKGTSLEGSRIYLGGIAATYKDLQQGGDYDLMIAGAGAICLIFIIMLIVTRAVVAALVIVGTVVMSLGASFGLSVLIWQHILGIRLHWMILAMSIIILLAVGSDYNLLLISRFKEEIPAGLKTGMIRSMAGTGTVVTSAGVVFAFTMCALVVSDLRIVGQIGTTIGLGLLFDTLVVRSFMTPSIASLLGRWFWWPLRVRRRPVPSPWPKRTSMLE